MSFNPKGKQSLELFLREVYDIFEQLEASAGNLSEAAKMGYIIAAIKKGSNTFDQTINYCKLANLTLAETISKLQSQASEMKLENMIKPTRHDRERANVGTQKVITCNNCGKDGHVQNDCTASLKPSIIQNLNV
jgi:hypothetical protein